jgi:hypothetical protein
LQAIGIKVGRKVLFSSLLEPNETAAAIVAIVVILERRIRPSRQ